MSSDSPSPRRVPSERWELGSELHWPLGVEGVHSDPHPWSQGANFYGTGRDALRHVIAYGESKRGWKRLWVPSYFCPDVVRVLQTPGLELAFYSDAPEPSLETPTPPAFQEHDVVLTVNTFGLRRGPPFRPPPGIDVIEDHTHDPWSAWSQASRAEYCVASLRKTLPLPTGAVLWSPVNAPMPSPPEVSSERRRSSLEKLAGMVLKALYLSGGPVSKTTFRDLARGGEATLADGCVSGMPEAARSLLDGFPIDQWREARSRNHAFLSERMKTIPHVRVLQPAHADDCCPFSAILVFDSHALRERVRRELEEQRVYGAVLWPLGPPFPEGIPPSDARLSQRLLSIHCDMRYEESDLLRVATAVALSIGEAE